MTPRHRSEPVKTGGAVRRAVVTSVLSALALTSVTITAAAVTLTGGEQHAGPPVTTTPPSTTATTTRTYGPSALAPPVDVEEAPIGIPKVALVAADGPVLADIPSAAVAAYQRAEAVLKGADKSCHLRWTLLAAIGQVVTQHGTQGGGALDAKGVMRPRFRGEPLTGKDGKRLPDSDAGKVDGDERFDRPVGPMQLAAPTWAIVGVDADGNGRRNPYDIDDASLAVGVLLCSGEDDLRQRAGRVGALKRVNADRSFIETVLAVDRTYQDQMADALAQDPELIPSSPFTNLPTDLPAKSAPPTPTDEPSSSAPTSTPSDDPTDQQTFGPTWTPSPLDTGTPSDTPSDCSSASASDSDSPSDLSTDGPSFASDPCPSDSAGASGTDPTS